MMMIVIIIFFFFTIVIIIVILENSDGYDGGGKIIKRIWMKKITHLNEQKHISGTGLHHLPGCPVGVSSKVQVKCKGLCKDNGRSTQQSEGVCVCCLVVLVRLFRPVADTDEVLYLSLSYLFIHLFDK